MYERTPKKKLIRKRGGVCHAAKGEVGTAEHSAVTWILPTVSYRVYRLADTSPTRLDTGRLRRTLGGRRVLPLPEMATTTGGQSSSRRSRHHALRSQLGSVRGTTLASNRP
jgi:hypothetical protein